MPVCIKCTLSHKSQHIFFLWYLSMDADGVEEKERVHLLKQNDLVSLGRLGNTECNFLVDGSGPPEYEGDE